MFRKMLMAIPIVTIAVGSTTACATKKFVRTSVGEVNGKVDSLGRSVEETQERTRQNEGKINEVDQRAQAAAAAAKTAADSANSAALAADGKAVAANDRVEAVDKASKRLVFEVVLSEDQGNFKFGKKELPDEAKAKLDELVNQLKADPKGAFFEIEGYTDNIGSVELNEKLGMERAEAVKRYLYQQHQIPLHKMNTISYGEDNPSGDNKTREGRAQNRRVVIKVLV